MTTSLLFEGSKSTSKELPLPQSPAKMKASSLLSHSQFRAEKYVKSVYDQMSIVSEDNKTENELKNLEAEKRVSKSADAGKSKMVFDCENSEISTDSDESSTDSIQSETSEDSSETKQYRVISSKVPYYPQKIVFSKQDEGSDQKSENKTNVLDVNPKMSVITEPCSSLLMNNKILEEVKPLNHQAVSKHKKVVDRESKNNVIPSIWSQSILHTQPQCSASIKNHYNDYAAKLKEISQQQKISRKPAIWSQSVHAAQPQFSNSMRTHKTYTEKFKENSRQQKKIRMSDNKNITRTLGKQRGDTHLLWGIGRIPSMMKVGKSSRPQKKIIKYNDARTNSAMPISFL